MNFCPKCKESLAPRQVDGVERLACSSLSCEFVFLGQSNTCCCWIDYTQWKISSRQKYSVASGMYSLITGFVEKGELPEQTISREAEEELGLTVESINFIGHFSLEQLNQLLIAYVVHTTGEISMNHEISETLSLSRSELAQFDFSPLGLTAEIVSRALQVA